MRKAHPSKAIVSEFDIGRFFETSKKIKILKFQTQSRSTVIHHYLGVSTWNIKLIMRIKQISTCFNLGTFLK